MLLGSVEEVLDTWCFFCCIRVLHVYNGLLPFAPGGRVRFLGQLQLLVALVVTVEGAEMGESRKALEAMGHVLRSWGTMRVRKDQNLPTLWSHTSQHSTRRISPCWSCIDYGFIYWYILYVYIYIYSKLFRGAHIHSRYMAVLIVLIGRVQWPYHGEAVNTRHGNICLLNQRMWCCWLPLATFAKETAMKEEELWAQERLTLKSSLEEVRLQALDDVFTTCLFLVDFRASSTIII